MPPNNSLTFDPLMVRILIINDMMNRRFYPFINIKILVGHSRSFADASLPRKDVVCQYTDSIR